MTADSTVPIPFEDLSKGDVLPAFPLEVSTDEVRAYLEATGEPVERWSGLVPPLMLVARMIGGLLARVAIPHHLLHAGQEFEMRRALRVDELVELRPTVTALGIRQGVVMASFGIDAVAADEEVVATSRASVVVPRPEAAEATS